MRAGAQALQHVEDVLELEENRCGCRALRRRRRRCSSSVTTSTRGESKAGLSGVLSWCRKAGMASLGVLGNQSSVTDYLCRPLWIICKSSLKSHSKTWTPRKYSGTLSIKKEPWLQDIPCEAHGPKSGGVRLGQACCLAGVTAHPEGAVRERGEQGVQVC